MSFLIKQIIFSTILNCSLFIMLIIGIQNSGTKYKVNFIFNESVALPLSFIIGVSFIGGSIFGSLTNVTDIFKKD